MATIQKRGSHQWRAMIRRKGHPNQSRTFDLKSDALIWARSIENKMDRGVFLSRDEVESTTLGECLKRYVREVSSQKLGAEQEAMKAKVIHHHSISDMYIGVVNGSDIAKYRDDRLRQGKAPSTVVKEMALLSHMFNVARREWGMEALSNPVQQVSKPRVSNKRDRRLSGEEEKRLMAACSLGFHNANPWLRPLIILAIETAMRKGELLALRWTDVKFDQNKVISKNKDPKGVNLLREVPLSPRAIVVLKNIPTSLNGMVFPTSDNAIKLAFNRACGRACEHVFDHKPGTLKACQCTGILNFRFHDLRHEATSRFFEKGLNPMQVAAITGHKTLQMLKRYTHLKAEDLAKLLG